MKLYTREGILFESFKPEIINNFPEHNVSFGHIKHINYGLSRNEIANRFIEESMVISIKQERRTHAISVGSPSNGKSSIEYVTVDGVTFDYVVHYLCNGSEDDIENIKIKIQRAIVDLKCAIKRHNVKTLHKLKS